MLEASRLAQSFVEGVGFEEYASDPLRTSAVERQLGIVGEAMTQLLRTEPQTPLTAARQIIGFRNILIYNYARVSQAVVWTILHDHLPVLQAEATVWLERLNQEAGG